MIPLSKQAGIFDTAEEYVWNSDEGPFENLFRLAENLGIMFGGGPLSLLLMGAEPFGLDFGILGKKMDEQLGLHQVSDLVHLDPEKLGQIAANTSEEISNEPQQYSGSEAQQAQQPAQQPGQAGGAMFGSIFGGAAEFRFKKQADEASQTPAPITGVNKPAPIAGLPKPSPAPVRLPPLSKKPRAKDLLDDLLQPVDKSQEVPDTKVDRGQMYGLEGPKTNVDPYMGQKAEKRWKEDLGERSPQDLREEQQQRNRQEKVLNKALVQTPSPGPEENPSFLTPTTQSPRSSLTKEELRAQRLKEKDMALNRKHQLKKMKYEQKLWGARENAYGSRWGRRLSGGAKAIAFGGLFTWLFKMLADPNSKISKVLRGAGIIGAETIHRQFSDAGQVRAKTSPTTLNPNSAKAALESAVDRILEE